MSDGYPVEIEGDLWSPVPESWIENGSDQDTGTPRIYAVSVAPGPRNMIKLRYASPDGRAVEVTTNGAENPTNEGTVPASLAKYHDWPRSLVPSRTVEPTDVLRTPETAHFREMWSDRLQERAVDDQRVATDGGRSE